MSDKQVNEQQEGGEKGKVEKQYIKNLSRLTALMKGSGNLKDSKLPKDEVGDLVDELIKERRLEMGKKFKTAASALIDKKRQFDKDVTELEKKFENDVTSKKKEFNQAMSDLFKMVDDMDAMEKEYYDTLKQGESSSEQVAEQTDK